MRSNERREVEKIVNSIVEDLVFHLRKIIAQLCKENVYSEDMIKLSNLVVDKLDGIYNALEFSKDGKSRHYFSSSIADRQYFYRNHIVDLTAQLECQEEILLDSKTEIRVIHELSSMAIELELSLPRLKNSKTFHLYGINIEEATEQFEHAMSYIIELAEQQSKTSKEAFQEE